MTDPALLVLLVTLAATSPPTSPGPALRAEPPALDAGAPAGLPAPRTERERAAIRDRLVRARADRVLGPAMAANGVGLWIVLTREDAPDPVLRYVTPDGTYPGGRNAYVYVAASAPAERPRRVAIGSHLAKDAAGFFDELVEARGDEVAAALRALAARHPEGKIAVNVAADTPLADGLSASLEGWLREALGPHAARLASAERLVVDALEPRLPEEQPLYLEAARIAEALWTEVLSARRIRPGVTRVGDLVWALRERAAALQVGLWFRPDFRVQRRGVSFDPGSPASLDTVVEAGDLLHLDLGVVHLDLSTDHQRMAYLPRPGEEGPPPGLVAALRATNRLQELLLAEMRPGRPGHEVHAAAMARAEAEGLRAMIYSHSVGFTGHFVGAAIGAFKPGAAPGFRAGLPLRAGATTAVELNTRSPVPEWGGQDAWIMLEDVVWLAPAGPRFLVPRQTSWILVR